jgi:dTDP-4-amino-4,6-dideoxygalactose transaminase
VIPVAAESKLALHGGEPVRRASYPSWPQFADDEIAAATDVMRSGRVNYWTGEQGRAFEREFADLCGCEHGVAVANGTVALELALHATGVRAGAEVITSSRTYVASASCIAMHGARPVFADVHRNSQNITAETIREVMTENTAAVIVVHLAGWPCEMDTIMELAREHKLLVIEDCAQAQGARYKGRPVGSFGDAAAFSFCQDKISTTLGEGGMLVTHNADVWKRAWAYKDHGKSYNSVNRREHPPGFRWLHESIGTNLKDVGAAGCGRARAVEESFRLGGASPGVRAHLE